MDEMNGSALAETVYEDLKEYLDSMGWNYEDDKDNLAVTFGVKGDDIPMAFIIRVDAGRQLLRVNSPLPFTVPEDKRMDMAIAT
ncbi:MAG: hypothetical protein IJM71_00260, partial [Clostridia bacterium]|nr:hypothetical protein [Clostridia bacterium]